ncbi:MAG TPA: ABC transporter substrate-binding protein [Opitutaceae bacterium]
MSVFSIRPPLFPRLTLTIAALMSFAANGRAETVTVASIHADLLPGLRTIGARFKAETGMDVSVQAVPYAAHELWVRTRLLAGNPPEVLVLEATNLPWRYGNSGQLVDIEAAVAGDPPAHSWLAKIQPELIQQARDPAGKLWCVPFTQFGLGYFYRQDTYQKLGLTPPLTWLELKSNYERIQAAGGVPQIVAVRSNDFQSAWTADILLELFLRPETVAVNLQHAPGWRYDPLDPTSTHGELVSLEERIIAFADGRIDPERAPAFAEVARLVAELAHGWRGDFLSLDGEEVPLLFARGESAHFLNGTWYLRAFTEIHHAMATVDPATVFPWGVFLFPDLTPDSTPLPLLGNVNQNSGLRACFSIPRQPSHPERERAAMAWVRFVSRPEVARELFANTDVYDLPAVMDAPPKPAVEVLLPKTRYAFLPLAQFRGYDAQSETEFWTLWQQFLSKRIDRVQFLQALSRSHRGALQRLARAQGDRLDRAFITAHLQGGHEL